MRPRLAFVAASLIASLSALAGPPALVTIAKGDVTLDGSSVPSTPFVLEEGKVLDLGQGASVVVLHQGAATRLHGPRKVEHSQLKAPSRGTDAAEVKALDALLAKDSNVKVAGASRDGTVRLVRPVPGDTIVAPQAVSWHCDACGSQSVSVTGIMDDEPVWTASGEGSVAYTGPALAPGAYMVTVGSRDFVINVAAADVAATLQQARKAADSAAQGLQASGEKDPAALASIPATVYMQAGMPTEALYVVDAALQANAGNADLQAMRADYEAQAGLGGE